MYCRLSIPRIKACGWLLHLLEKGGICIRVRDKLIWAGISSVALKLDLRQYSVNIKSFVTVKSKIYFYLPICHVREINSRDIVKSKLKPPKLRIFKP